MFEAHGEESCVQIAGKGKGIGILMFSSSKRDPLFNKEPSAVEADCKLGSETLLVKFQNSVVGAGEMNQPLKAFAALAADWSSIPRTLRWLTTTHNSIPGGSSVLF